MKMEEHFKETLNRAVANEPPALDAWDRFERRTGRGRRVRLFAGIAAATAIAVASVVVVPRLGTTPGIGLSTNPPSTSPTPTVDPYANFQPLQYQAESWILYHPQSWTQSAYEGVTSLQPRDVENVNKGLPTFVVDIRLEVDTPLFPDPEGEDAKYVGARAIGGRQTYRYEASTSGTHIIKYRIDWTKPPPPCPTPPGSCGPTGPRTLVVAIRGSTDELWNKYISDAQLIADSIEYSDTAGG